MTNEIGNIVKEVLEQFRIGGVGTNQFIDKLAGVVRVVSTTHVAENNTTVIKTFPIACDVTYDECTRNGAYKDLIPNSKYGCMVYLEEESGVELQETVRKTNTFKVSFRIVGWINQKKLGKNECSITGQIVNTLISALQIKPFNSGIYQTIQINVIGQDPKSFNPFAKYTYDEDATKYTMPPYDYFSIRIDVLTNVNPTCIIPFEIETPIICNTI